MKTKHGLTVVHTADETWKACTCVQACVHMCACIGVSTYVHMRIYSCGCMYTWGGQRTISSVVSQTLSILFFEKGSLTDLELTN